MLTEDEYYCYTITWLMLLFNSFVTIYSNKYFLLFPSPNAAPRPFGSQFAVVMWLECLETFVRLVGFWVFWGILTLFCLLRPLPLQLSQVWVRVWDFISNILVCVQSSKEKFSKLPPNLDEMTGKHEAPGRSFGWLNIETVRSWEQLVQLKIYKLTSLFALGVIFLPCLCHHVWF